MRRILRQWSIGLMFWALIFLFCGIVSACPTCKESLAHSDANHATLVRGYFWSILFMMSMPFLILAGLGTYMYLQIRRARTQLAGASATVDSPIELESRELVEV